MAMDMKMTLKQTQKLVMTPMLQQAIKLLPLARLDLVQLIRHEMVENPMLEEILLDEEDNNIETDDTERLLDDKGETENQQEEREEIDWEIYLQENIDRGISPEDYIERASIDSTIRKEISLSDYLIWQLDLVSYNELDKRIGTFLIGNIDSDGYLKSELTEIAEMCNVEVGKVEEVLKLIQTFDPSGVGARDIKECLILQVENIGGESDGSVVVKNIIERYLDQLDERHFLKIAKGLKISIEEVIRGVKFIRTLDPKPGRRFNSEDVEYIIPDIIIVKTRDDYQIIFNDEGIPTLRINPFYRGILKSKSRSDPAREYLENKFRSALWLIKGIEQRRQTIYKVVKSIIKFQRGFLDKGLPYLKPLILRTVADDINMHESTVSRVTTNKYVHTPQGIFELKFFFHSGINSVGGGDMMSSVMVKDMIKKMVSEEDPTNPIIDEQIAEMIRKRGIDIARRTITKYRKEIRILPANRRRKIFIK
ncbi:MAG: RNA polymerase factor sigma-54 [Nitrospinae bacterium]|nr:RNA polymerase factor sigma-54 [Nitrospinota bacterium]